MYTWADTTLDLKYISYYIDCSQNHLKTTAQETFLAHVHRDIYRDVHSSTKCISEKLKSKCPLVGNWINKIRYIHTVDSIQKLG